ncbi:MAG: DUF2800 domain-containing protein [Pseudomonadota bacterium]
MTAHAQRAHSELSPSGAHRWMRCPGSVAACRGLPDAPGEAALEGTRAHEIAERVLRDDLKTAMQAFDDAMGPPDTEMARAVDRYVEFVRAEPGELLIETRVRFGDYVPNGAGTCDALIFSPDGYRMTVMDLKYGVGVRVEAEENPQLMAYALGALEEYDTVYDDVEEVRLCVHQPRLYHLSVWSIRADDLYQWAEKVLRPAAKVAMADDAPRVPGEVQCKFCAARGSCGAFTEFALAAAGEGFDVPDEGRANRDLTPEEVGEALGKVAAVKTWISAIEGEGQRLLELGKTVPGWKLVKGQSRRFWADEDEALARLKKTKFKVDEVAPRQIVSPAGAEKLFGKGDVPDKIYELIARKDGAPKLAPESDKRPALSMNAAEGFEPDEPTTPPTSKDPEPEPALAAGDGWD